MQLYIAGWCGSMRLEPGQYGYQYGIEIRVKLLNMTKTFFSAVSYSRNPSWIDTGYNEGLYGSNQVDTVFIPYGPGSKSGCVWLHSRNADLIVNCFDPFNPCGPPSNSLLTCTDPCRPAAANIKEKLVKLGQTRVDPFRTAATPTDSYLPFSYSGNQLLNPKRRHIWRISSTLILNCTRMMWKNERQAGETTGRWQLDLWHRLKLRSLFFFKCVCLCVCVCVCVCVCCFVGFVLNLI
jgi:hypothetical protein